MRENLLKYNMASLALVACLTFMVQPSQAQSINYTYDNAGRLVLLEYDTGVSIRYTYDDAGNVLSQLADRSAGKEPPTDTKAASANDSPGTPSKYVHTKYHAQPAKGRVNVKDAATRAQFKSSRGTGGGR